MSNLSIFIIVLFSLYWILGNMDYGKHNIYPSSQLDKNKYWIQSLNYSLFLVRIFVKEEFDLEDEYFSAEKILIDPLDTQGNFVCNNYHSILYIQLYSVCICNQHLIYSY